MVKNLPLVQGTRIQSLNWEDALEKGMATHSSILAWRISWTGAWRHLWGPVVGHDWVTHTALLSTAGWLLVTSQLSWWSSSAFNMCILLFSGPHVFNSSPHSLVDPNPLTFHPGGNWTAFLSFHSWPVYVLFMEDILTFFRALSQDDQDDIHLKLEDIIQLVSWAIVLSCTINYVWDLTSQRQALCPWLVTGVRTICSIPETVWKGPDLARCLTSWSMMLLLPDISELSTFFFRAGIRGGLCTSATTLSWQVPGF